MANGNNDNNGFNIDPKLIAMLLQALPQLGEVGKQQSPFMEEFTANKLGPPANTRDDLLGVGRPPGGPNLNFLGGLPFEPDNRAGNIGAVLSLITNILATKKAKDKTAKDELNQIPEGRPRSPGASHIPKPLGPFGLPGFE